jgi:TolB protein
VNLRLLACVAVLLAGCAPSTEEFLKSPPLPSGVPQGRLLYVSKDDGEAPAFRIEMLDLGMAAPRVLAQSREPLASPRWSPDGRAFAYVSLESGRATLIVQTLSGTPQKLVSDADAIGAPAWSPDGAKIAFSMLREGNTDLFLLDLSSQTAARLTQEPGGEADPGYAPDGRSLVMTSDRGGTPTLYDLTLKRLRARPLVEDSPPEASRASYAPDGHRVVYVLHGESGTSIELLDLDSGERIALSSGPADDAPAFSPDGKFVAYTTHADGHAIELVSADGRVRQSLKTATEVREPSWARSP